MPEAAQTGIRIEQRCLAHPRSKHLPGRRGRQRISFQKYSYVSAEYLSFVQIFSAPLGDTRDLYLGLFVFLRQHDKYFELLGIYNGVPF